MGLSTTIYLIRHGESEANERDVFLGHYDLPLTQNGRNQAAMTAAYLAEYAPVPDAIYTSDLKRAYETAQYTAERLHKTVITEKELREIDAGDWDNRSFDDLSKHFAESYHTWITDIGHARCDGGESVEELRERVVSYIIQIAQIHDGGVLFLFTHATPIRAFAAHCLRKTHEEMKTVPWATNASVTKAVFEAAEFRLVEYSRDDFMGDSVTKLPENV